MLWREDLVSDPKIPRAERRRPGLADLLDYDVVLRPGVVGLKSAALLAGFRLAGPDLETAAGEDLDQLHAAFVCSLAPFGDGWVMHYDVRREARPSYPCRSGHGDAFSRLADAKRRERYEGRGEHYRTSAHLTWTWYLPSRGRRVASTLLTGDAGFLDPEEHLESFERALGDFAEGLRTSFEIERLGTAALLRHLHTCVTGLSHPVAAPGGPVFLDQLLASQDLIAGSPLQVGERYVLPLGFFGLPERETHAGILEGLARLPLTYRYCVRLLFLDPATAQSRIAAIRSQWARAGLDWRHLLAAVFSSRDAAGRRQRPRFENRFAASMADDADEALAAALGGQRFAVATPTVLVEGASLAEVERGAAQVISALRNAGFPARPETLNGLQAWLGQLPGNAWCNRRKLLLPTDAAATLLPLTSVWVGHERCPHPDWPETSPLAVVDTASRESFYLNLHVADVGHTLIFGPTGTGKSVLLNFLISSFRRYERAAIYSFDVGLSQLAHCLAAGGVHYHLGEGGLRLAPLAHLGESPRELAAALEWVEEVLTLEGERIDAAGLEMLEAALGQLAEMPAPYRTLSHLQAKLQSPELRRLLRPYTSAGPYGELLDGSESHLAERSFLVFEMGRLLQRKAPAVVPVLLHLFEEIRRRLDGRPTLILVEEGSVFLRNTRFAREIGDWLVGLRKLGAAVVFVTQSVQHVLDSDFLPIFLESCPTKIFLPNPKLRAAPRLRSAYEAIGLGEREIEVISEAVPRRDYFLTSPEGSRLFRLELSPLELALYGVSRPPQIQAVRELRERHGDGEWVARWLESQDLTDEAAALRRQAAERKT